MRVLQVLHTLVRAGAEQLVYELATANRGRAEMAVICLDVAGPLAEELRAEGVQVVHTCRREGLDVGQFRRIARVIRSFRPEVVHCHQYTPFFYGALASVFAGRGRVLFTEHGRHYPDVVSGRRRMFNRLLARKAERITAVCEFTRRRLVEKEGIAAGRIEVVYNGVDVSRFDGVIGKPQARQRLSIPQDALVVAHVGTFRPVKDHATAVRSFKRVQEAGASAVLLFVGTGPELPACRELVAGLGLAERVRFLDSRSDVPQILAAADVMLLTSLSEAHSVALLEGMAAGLPVVATDVGGNGETVVHGQTGLLAPPGDDAAIADCLLRLLRQGELRGRMGLAGRERVKACFSRGRMHQRYLEIYEELAERNWVA